MSDFTSNDILGLSDSLTDNFFRVTIIHPSIDTDLSKILAARCIAFDGPDSVGPDTKGVQFGQWTRFQIDGLNNSAQHNTISLGFIDDADRKVSNALKTISSGQRNKDVGAMPAIDSSSLKFSIFVEVFKPDAQTVADSWTYTGVLMKPLPNLRFDRSKSQSGNVAITANFNYEDIKR